jgi:hypothetical protein
MHDENASSADAAWFEREARALRRLALALASWAAA